MARPEDRYDNLDVKTLPNGRQVYRSARPIKIESSDSDLQFAADEKDRLDIIAYNTYGDANEWWRLAVLNRKFRGSLHTRPNVDLRVPQK